jgi:hypothetical protein
MMQMIKNTYDLYLLSFRKSLTTLAILFFAHGCGGGGNQVEESRPPPPPVASTEYNIRTEVSIGGAISPQSINLAAGKNISFTLQPIIGYFLESINGCSGTLKELQYSVSNISEDCTIQVTFRNVTMAPHSISAIMESNQAQISWDAVEYAQSYKVYYASQSFTSLTDKPETTIALSTTATSVSLALNKSFNNYYVRVSAVFGDKELLSTEQIRVIANFQPIGGINDTAVTYCLTTQLAVDGCESEYTQRQDGSVGRDAAATINQISKIGVGSAGFDFSKISRNGEILSKQTGSWLDSGSEADGQKWSCVRDNVTGLVWEVKQPGGINSTENTFTWFSDVLNTNGGEPGILGNSLCGLSHCNTASYISYLNSIQFCGSRHWRLPTRAELNNIVMNTGAAPRLDPLVFPDVRRNTSYWTSSTYHPINQYAWAISMNSGIVFWQPKNTELSVRLVHSE